MSRQSCSSSGHFLLVRQQNWKGIISSSDAMHEDSGWNLRSCVSYLLSYTFFFFLSFRLNHTDYILASLTRSCMPLEVGMVTQPSKWSSATTLRLVCGRQVAPPTSPVMGWGLRSSMDCCTPSEGMMDRGFRTQWRCLTREWTDGRWLLLSSIEEPVLVCYICRTPQYSDP